MNNEHLEKYVRSLEKSLDHLERRITVLENTRPIVYPQYPVNPNPYPFPNYPVCTCNMTSSDVNVVCPMHGTTC